MINVICDREKLCLKVTGHARSDLPGRDLVCCSVSTLVYTLGTNVLAMEKKGWAELVKVELAPGRAEIAFVPGKGFRGMGLVCFDTVSMGLQMLARNYPQYILWEEMGDREGKGSRATISQGKPKWPRETGERMRA